MFGIVAPKLLACFRSRVFVRPSPPPSSTARPDDPADLPPTPYSPPESAQRPLSASPTTPSGSVLRLGDSPPSLLKKPVICEEHPLT